MNSGIGVGGEGTYSSALNLAGTIANEAATGNGQFLTGSSGNAHTEGLQILVSATGIACTDGRATWTEVLPVPAAALTATSSPPFQRSPYGVVTGLTTAVQTAPDGTVQPVGTPPCQNPY